MHRLMLRQRPALALKPYCFPLRPCPNEFLIVRRFLWRAFLGLCFWFCHSFDLPHMALILVRRAANVKVFFCAGRAYIAHPPFIRRINAHGPPHPVIRRPVKIHVRRFAALG